MIQTLTCRMEIAARYGLNVAIFIHHIVHWTMKNESEGKHFYDGRYWAYASYDGLVRWFAPLWSNQQVKRIVAKCKDEGLILVGNYNESPTDRTNWYSPCDEILQLYTVQMDSEMVVRNRPMESSILNKGWFEIDECNNVNINNKINIPPIVPHKRARREAKKEPDWKPDRFADFWKAYPRGESKQAAINAWDRLKPDDKLLEAMARGLMRQLKSEQWQAGIGIPYASTWINQRRWEDEEKSAAVLPLHSDNGGLKEWL